MWMWGEVDMLWTEGLAEWWRGRRRRRAERDDAATLVAEAERWLSAVPPRTDPREVFPAPGWSWPERHLGSEDRRPGQGERRPVDDR